MHRYRRLYAWVSYGFTSQKSIQFNMEDSSQFSIDSLQGAGFNIGPSTQRLISQPKSLLYAALAAITTAWLLSLAIQRTSRLLFSRPISPDPEQPPSLTSPEKPLSSSKHPQRLKGEWIPIDFKRPAASPYPNWDVHTTKPLPYRPFRHGPYYITMGLRTMKWDEWIELDNQFPKFHADKAKRIEERGAKCSKTAPEAFDGACELLEEL